MLGYMSNLYLTIHMSSLHLFYFEVGKDESISVVSMEILELDLTMKYLNCLLFVLVQYV